MNTDNTKSKINVLAQAATELIDEVKASQGVINEDLSGGMKSIIADKLGVVESNVKNIVSTLAEINDIIDNGVKKLKKSKQAKTAADVWSLLK